MLVVVCVFEKKREPFIADWTVPVRVVDVVGDGDEECIQLIVHANRHPNPLSKWERLFVLVCKRHSLLS